MLTARRHGFSLLETVIALTLFGGALLSVLGIGQVVLARLHESDQRFRASLYTQSILDSLRATACARLSSGSTSSGPFHATWSLTDLRDAARIDLSLTAPRRGATPQVGQATALLPCPEP
ncbi:MAG: prepilin-type N-terminal cleavage/methylation domain-containing protein [Gemmatimonadota bacterium]